MSMMMWTVALEGGPRRVNHAAARVGERIYSFGGYCSVDELNDEDRIQVHILDTDSLRWTIAPSLGDYAPNHRYGHSVVSIDNKIYLWGGRNDSMAFDPISCYDTRTLTWHHLRVSGLRPWAKDGHSACVINNKMYIFGGYEYSTNEYTQKTHCFNFATSEWSYINPIGDLPSVRDFHTAVAIGDYMYVFGGRGFVNGSDEDDYCRKLYRFNTKTRTWDSPNTSGDIPEGRRSHSAWFYNGFMYIFGGYNGNANTHFNDLYRLSPKDHKWQSLKVGGQPPCQRRRQCCIMYKDKLYLFGGTSPHTHIYIEEPPENTHETIDNSDLHVLDYNVSLRTLCILAVIKHKVDYSNLPRSIHWDIAAMTEPNTISRPIEQIY